MTARLNLLLHLFIEYDYRKIQNYVGLNNFFYALKVFACERNVSLKIK